MVGQNVWPPLHLVHFLEMNLDGLLIFEGPGGFVCTD
jgi:hypothetical protein